MEKYITDERTGLKYELVGDYYLVADDDCLTERFHHDVPIEMSYLIVILLSTALYCDKSPPSLST